MPKRPPQRSGARARTGVPPTNVAVAVAGAALVLGLVIAWAGDDDDDSASTTTRDGTSATTDVTTPGGTPRPDAAQTAAIEAGVAAVYPGLPPGKAAEFAVATCQDIRQGWDEAQLRLGTIAHFGGGDRPDPTDEQAGKILEVIRSSGYCVF